MEFEKFKLQMADLANYLDVSVKTQVLQNDYYPKFKRYDTKQMEDIITWVKNNYEHSGGKQFPLVPVFRRAISSLMAPSTYKPATAREKVDKKQYSLDLKALADKYRVEDDGSIQMPKNKQVKLCLQMLHDRKVYSVKLQKWIDEDLRNNTGGIIVDPMQKLEAAYIGSHKRYNF